MRMHCPVQEVDQHWWSKLTRDSRPPEHGSGGAADCWDRAIIPSDAKLDAVSVTSQQHGGVGIVPACVHAPCVLAAVSAPLRLLGRVQIGIS